MKTSTLLLFVFCCTLKSCFFNQTLSEKNMRDKETIEIEHITDCLEANRSVDNLLEWQLSSKNDSLFIFKYKARLAFFTLHKDTKGIFLHEISYFKNSFQKIIFFDDTLTKYEVNCQTRFRVWMSKDSLSIYFCMINPDNTKIWVLTNGNTVYTLVE